MQPTNVMLSIHHEHDERILRGVKTLEIRKSAPSPASYPYIIYMYETKGLYKGSGGVLMPGAGAVVGFFMCKGVIKTNTFQNTGNIAELAEEYNKEIAERACLTIDELIKYAAGKDIYGLDVSTPIRFPRPRPLSDFGISRAPQSWQYIKNMK